MAFSGAMGHGIESARQPLSAAANASILGEVAHQVRRLSHHPSVFLYDGANEVIVERSGPSSLYATLVMAAVAAEDPTRIILPSSPSIGWRELPPSLTATPALHAISPPPHTRARSHLPSSCSPPPCQCRA
jgi:hypothetical protein